MYSTYADKRAIMHKTISMVGLKNTMQNERYVSGVFDNEEKTLDNKEI